MGLYAHNYHPLLQTPVQDHSLVLLSKYLPSRQVDVYRGGAFQRCGVYWRRSAISFPLRTSHHGDLKKRLKLVEIQNLELEDPTEFAGPDCGCFWLGVIEKGISYMPNPRLFPSLTSACKRVFRRKS